MNMRTRRPEDTAYFLQEWSARAPRVGSTRRQLLLTGMVLLLAVGGWALAAAVA